MVTPDCEKPQAVAEPPGARARDKLCVKAQPQRFPGAERVKQSRHSGRPEEPAPGLNRGRARNL